MGDANMPLALAPLNRPLTVIRITAGCGLSRRLADLGIVPGVELRLVNPDTLGPVIVDLKGARLALGRGVAQRVMVVEKPD